MLDIAHLWPLAWAGVFLEKLGLPWLPLKLGLVIGTFVVNRCPPESLKYITRLQKKVLLPAYHQWAVLDLMTHVVAVAATLAVHHGGRLPLCLTVVALANLAHGLVYTVVLQRLAVDAGGVGDDDDLQSTLHCFVAFGVILVQAWVALGGRDRRIVLEVTRKVGLMLGRRDAETADALSAMERRLAHVEEFVKGQAELLLERRILALSGTDQTAVSSSAAATQRRPNTRYVGRLAIKDVC